MIGAALVVFREVLEAALIIAIVTGATRGVAGRLRWINAGIAAGVVGAVIVAAFAGAIAGALQGRGQEVFNATILLAAVVMLAWHNSWMSAHGREITRSLIAVGKEITAGNRPLSALAMVTFFAVLREGSETVLFLYGLGTGSAGKAGLLFGGMLGLAGGAAVGWLLYRGLLVIPAGRFITVVNWLLVLLAAGLAANAALYLNSAGLVPALGTQAWDTSSFLSQRSWLGTFLHILVGYTDRPMGVQVLFYVVTVIAMLVLMRLSSGHRRVEARSTGGAR